jgi:cysteine sulfinate desulfinase/cysteine desulfurase-like protein
MYDASAVGAAAAAAGVPFLLDACQTAGQVPLDVQELQCDFLTGGASPFNSLVLSSSAQTCCLGDGVAAYESAAS